MFHFKLIATRYLSASKVGAGDDGLIQVVPLLVLTCYNHGMNLPTKKIQARFYLPGGKIARVIFTLIDDDMVLLNSFIKKTQKTPTVELETARKRLKDIQNAQ